jgi:hypothetical protein
MRKGKLAYLLVAIVSIPNGFLSVWLAMLQGFTTQTAGGLASFILGVVCLRRWWQGEK